MDASAFPLFSLVTKSGPFARLIILLISVFSVSSIAVIIFKYKQIRGVFSKNKKFIRTFNQAGVLTEVDFGPQKSNAGVLERVGREGISEFNRIIKEVGSRGESQVQSFFVETQFAIVKDHLEKTVSEETQKTDKYLVLLAITASTCPLLGLLGTVWGIMRAFLDIGLVGSASLNVVAPGIAEALVTTIWGISVAVPAVICYNYFANKTKMIENEAYNFSAHLFNLIKIEFFDLVYQKRHEQPAS